eukprot:g19890.t1
MPSIRHRLREAYAVWGLITNGARGIMGGLSGWMGIMSLMEARRIWKLRKARQLNTHPLFEVAKSWRRTERDAFGVVHRINHSDFDDEQPLTSGGWGNFCALLRRDELSQPLTRGRSKCCCCCFFMGGPTEAEEVVPPSLNTAQQQSLRAQRDQFVQRTGPGLLGPRTGTYQWKASMDEVLDIARIHGDSGQLLAERDGLTGLLSNLSGADLNLVIVPFSSPDEKTSRTFLEALYRNNVRELEKVLAVPVDPNHIFCEGTEEEDPALLIAAREGCSDVVQLLMEAMANLDHPDITGCTALWVACLNGNFEVVRLLLEYRADHGKACDGDTPLITARGGRGRRGSAAKAKGHPDIVAILLEAQADVNQADLHFGKTPLWMASYAGHLEIVNQLLDAAALLDMKDFMGCSPFEVATEQNHKRVAQLLLTSGFDKLPARSGPRTPSDGE